ncbi:hypothetical protein KSC_022260 [Ktedonobacter sp. SOSP1-52]|uniref:hypothetical protein n=1 Tax=Ktedonobacter sp. SOSP1-52 TaxID=2778366 RepID=UPI0019168F7D|nr:hypothetical protein [Ktedonobacter sp. SOSP1-52]GHO63334.1 hypothetical protein KSC_022260 [Ktedonobacter sp. SOSP1-52]
MTNIFFKSAAHKERLLTVMGQIGKIYGENLDQEYTAALYLLTSDQTTWEKAQEYVSSTGIDFDAMLKEMDLSGGYGVLVSLAGNLFNAQTELSPIELIRLDDKNFTLALTALKLRRYSLRISDLKSKT